MSKPVKAMAILAILLAGLAWTSESQAQAQNDVYIVQLKGRPAVAYEGGEPGLAATKPAKGIKLDPQDPAVQQYVQHLVATQDSVLGAVGGEKVYSYRYAFNGFAARLTPEQVEALKQQGEVVQVWKDEKLQLQTDSTPAFLGLSGKKEVWEKEKLLGEDVVVGIIDTGIWPEHPSFADTGCDAGDKGKECKPYKYKAKVKDKYLDQEQQEAASYGPPPASFTSSGCDFGPGAGDLCSDKLLAARCYNRTFSLVNGGVALPPDETNPCGSDGTGLLPSEYNSARDNDGHGSHTASTAAGNLYVPASIQGEDLGRVSGMAPRARIAVYKVCWNGSVPPAGFDNGCYSSDSAAAIDQAVADGVDVINFSIGGSSTFFGGPDDVAFLFAADAGVFVATSNGNAGPGAQTVGTPAGVPWITAVGASEDDQSYGTGLAVSTPGSIAGTYDGLEGAGPVSLADTGDVSGAVVPADPANACGNTGIDVNGDPIPVGLANAAAIANNIALVIRGVCGFEEKYLNAQAAGATAIVVYNDGTSATRIDPITMGGLNAPALAIPGIMIGFYDGDLVAGTSGVSGTVGPSIQIPRVDRIAGFSSRGPNGGAPDIIKPDVAAPGVRILAAQTPVPNDGQTPGQYFQIISGTSMASPHVAGVGALIKQEHPDWTPAMIRSALMTTARQDLLKTFGDTPADAFDIGAGQIVPEGALSPGLVYDADIFDYVRFTCGSEQQSTIFTPGTCAFFGSIDSSDLNLPSIAVAKLAGEQTVTRTVTSVKKGSKHWRVEIDAPPGVDVSVNPSSLTLKEGETATYEVTFTATQAAVLDQWAFGSLTWVNRSHDGDDDGDDDDGYGHGRWHKGVRVSSPIAVEPVLFAAPAEVEGSGTTGSVSFEVGFGYDGAYSADFAGLAAAEVAAGRVDGPSGGFAGIDFQVSNVPPGSQHLRVATYDEDVDSPGDDDLDLRLFACLDGSSVGSCLGTITAFVGSSGSFTSREQIDVPNPVPGGYLIVIDGFFTVGPDTAYKVFSHAVVGDEGNTAVTAPTAATLGTGQLNVDWTGLNSGTRYLGFITHSDGSAELARTFVAVDTQ